MSTFHNLHFVQGNNEYDYYPQVDDTLSVEGTAAIKAACARGVWVYGYINAGANKKIYKI